MTLGSMLVVGAALSHEGVGLVLGEFAKERFGFWWFG